MSKVMKKSTRFFTLSLCIALLFTNTLFLAPVVGAASDTNHTKTESTSTNHISSAEEAELTQRAIAIDEAKKEAQAAVDEQLAIIALEEESEEETEAPEAETETPSEEETTAPDTASADEQSSDDESAESSSPTDENDEETDADSNSATPAAGFLMGIDNPDASYSGSVVSMSDEEREYCERMVMGEAGYTGYTGMALVAQCIRDTYVAGNYSSVAEVIRANGYYGSTSIEPTETCKEVVRYIFDQGGSAVQHRIQVFYASDICTSEWHESQNYVCSYGYQKFFDCY